MLKKSETILKAIEWVAFIVLLCLLFVVISPKLPFKNIPKSFVVVSGSMEPTIKTGSVAFIKTVDPKNIKTGDIIAFTSPSNSQDTILHRVNSISSTDPLLFKTKGDNNKDIDAWDVQDVGVKGVYFFAIPYLGSLAALLRQPVGFAVIIGIPALIFIISQIFNIKKAIDDEVNRKVAQKLETAGTKIKIKPKSKTNLKSLIFFFLFTAAILGVNHITQAKALFSDTVVVSGITISTADFAKPSTPSNLHWSNPNIACNGYTNSYTITPDWDDSASSQGILKYEYYLEYPKAGGGTGTWSTFVTRSQYTGVFNQGEGLHTFKVRAYDTTGNVSAWSHECSITYDKTLPVSTITKPWNSDHDNDVNFPIVWLWNGKVEGTASDNSQLDHIELSIYRQNVNLFWNGSSWVHGSESVTRVLADGTSNWSYEIKPMTIPLGKFKIIAHAVDKAGNIENSAIIEFENTDVPELITEAGNDPLISLTSNHSKNEITLKIDNLSKPSDYEVLYFTNGIQKGLFGKITADKIVDSEFSQILYLGTCSSGGVCVQDDLAPGSTITVNLSGDTQVTKSFVY